MRRKAVEKLDAAKNALVSGLWSNPNLDDGKQTRQKILSDIEEAFKEAIDDVYNKSSENEIDFENDPFFAAMKLPDVPEGYVAYPEPHDKQHEEKLKLIRKLDQS